MKIISLFVSTEDQLRSFFPGWKPALWPPVIKTAADPFTNEPRTYTEDTVEYGPDDVYEYSMDHSMFESLGLPEICDQVSPDSLTRLARELGLQGDGYRRALSEPPDSETVALQVEPAVVDALVELAESRFVAVGRAAASPAIWTGVDLSDLDAASLAKEIVALARKVKAEGSLRLYFVQAW